MNSTEIILANVIVVVGSFLQAATGLGGGLIMVPLLLMISFDFVPAAVLVASFFLSLTMMLEERDAIDKTNLSVIIVALLVGSFVGGLVLYNIAFEDFVHLFAWVLLFAVMISLFPKSEKIPRPLILLASVISGFMGTVAGVGAPLLALLFQFQKPKTIRATLALLYVVSIVMMLSVLYVINRFHWYEFSLGILLLPGIFIGWKLAPWVKPYIDQKRARVIILLFVMATSLHLLLKY